MALFLLLLFRWSLREDGVLSTPPKIRPGRTPKDVAVSFEPRTGCDVSLCLVARSLDEVDVLKVSLRSSMREGFKAPDEVVFMLTADSHSLDRLTNLRNELTDSVLAWAPDAVVVFWVSSKDPW